MKTLTPIMIGASALVLAACSQPAEDAETGGQAEPETAAEEAEFDPASLDNETLNAAARAACERGREGFIEEVPDGAAFAFRGPDAVLRLACTRDGRRDAWIVPVVDLTPEERTPLDLAVAEMLRHNAGRTDDRATSGFFSARDGGLCAIQLDEAVARPLCEEAARAAAALESRAGEE